MATSGLYGSSPSGATVAAPGSESAGLYGNSTTFGGSYFEWFIFIQSDTQPATPTGGSWSFTTNSGTPPTGWSVVPPSAPTLPIWVSIALVNSKNLATLTWSAPGLFAYSSGLPILSGTGEPNSGDGLTDQLYIQTGTTPETIWFKQAGTWTRLTGSTLYADLTSNQTIAGTKTFSSQIQGSISGTASNVTGIVGITNGGTGSTTAAGARTALGVTATGQDTTYAYRANNLSDLASASSARTNLGLGTSAVLDAGVANGVATLDSGGTVPLSQIPASIQGGVSYQGTWNASTNTPTLTSSVGTKGYYYVVSVAGSTNLNGITDWQIGDWAIYSGTAWQKIDNTDAVTSVNGYTGTVVLNAADVGALSNVTSTDGSVTITSPTSTTRDLSVATAASTTNVLCQVRNATGATLTKGTVVYISGATGQLPTVSKAIATGDSTSAQTLGMMTADLANNSNGYVTVIGLITNIDTSAYTDGAQLYLSGTTAGTVTATKPYAPIHLVYVAVVEYAHPTQGKLFVKVQNGYELDEIHNVSAQTPSNGQTIVYNSSNQLWENNTVSLTLGVNGVLPIANGGTGQTTANAAFNALAPSQTGNSGKYLTTDGTNTSWAINAGGDVVGPASSTNNGIALFDGTTGKLLKNSATQDGLIYGLTVGRGAGAVSTNTAVGASALAANTTGSNNNAFGNLSLTSNTTGYGNSAFGQNTLQANIDGYQNTAVGGGALIVNTSGYENTSVGNSSLFSNTTGANNSAFGRSSLRLNTTGSSNTALGSNALYSNTTASNNTAVGYQAAYSNTTGTGIAAFGYQALLVNSSGNNNTAFGLQALRDNTASRNTGIGFQSLVFNSTGSDNTGLGYYANFNTTTGSYNTAVGSQALNTNSTSSNNTAVGYQSLRDATGANNTALGFQSLIQNTTASNNTAVGYQAAYSNTTGTDNTAIGWSALFANTTGSYQTAIGRRALIGNTTGTENVAVGASVLASNIIGNYNVGIGNAALLSNTTASYNTAVGYLAGQSITTGGYNTSIGRLAGGASGTSTGTDNTSVGNAAGNSITSGNNNTSVGSGALQQNTTASNNTAVGYQAGYSNTTGADNVAVGVGAFYFNTTGGSNVAVGKVALYNNTTGNYNTAIGLGSLINNTTASDSTAVGYQAAYSNITGAGVTAIGKDALRNSTASFNTAIGRSAGGATTTGFGNFFGGVNAAANNTNGSYNTAVGGLDTSYAAVMEANTTGSYNTAFGSAALRSNTTASNNTAVGYQAGYSNTTGAQNVSLGYQAGYGVTTGNWNTLIGTQAGLSITTGTQNTFVGASGAAGAGYQVTTGSKNTILGGFSGNGGGLDIRTANNYIVLSDGDGNPRGYFDNNGAYRVTGNGTFNPNTLTSGHFAIGGPSAGGWGVSSGIGARATDQSYALGSNGAGVYFGVGIPSTSAFQTIWKANAGNQDYTLEVEKGVRFPATQNASSDANTLDDYEEGTWTPTDASGAGLTFTTVGGNYTKIGRQVIAYFNVTFPSTTNSAGITIGGLPYTSSSAAAVANPGSGGFTYQTASISNVTMAIGSGGAQFNLWTLAGTQVPNINASTYTLRGWFQYFTN